MEASQAPIFLGVVLEVCTVDGPRHPKAARAASGPAPYAFERPTADDNGTLGACHLLVLSYSPSQYKRSRYADMPQLAAATFVEATFAPIIHEKRGRNDIRGETARMETHWLQLEDVVACEHTLGVALAPLGVQSGQSLLATGQPITFTTDTKKNKYQRARLQSAMRHFPCAVVGARPMCEVCRRVYEDISGAAGDDGGLLRVEQPPAP